MAKFPIAVLRVFSRGRREVALAVYRRRPGTGWGIALTGSRWPFTGATLERAFVTRGAGCAGFSQSSPRYVSSVM